MRKWVAWVDYSSIHISHSVRIKFRYLTVIQKQSNPDPQYQVYYIIEMNEWMNEWIIIFQIQISEI